ncbi:MAG: hypothetical protein ABSG61_13355 [Gemmatimonadales bacterium]|jgi:hypothetical protein
MQFPEQKAPPQIEQELPPPDGAVVDTAQYFPELVAPHVQFSATTVRLFAAASEIPWQSAAVLHALVQIQSLAENVIL